MTAASYDQETIWCSVIGFFYSKQSIYDDSFDKLLFYVEPWISLHTQRLPDVIIQ